MEPLTDAERMTVVLIAEGFRRDDIAMAMGVSEERVKTRLRSARAKYKAAGTPVGTLIRLRLQLIREGLIEE